MWHSLMNLVNHWVPVTSAMLSRPMNEVIFVGGQGAVSLACVLAGVGSDLPRLGIGLRKQPLISARPRSIDLYNFPASSCRWGAENNGE